MYDVFIILSSMVLTIGIVLITENAYVISKKTNLITRLLMEQDPEGDLFDHKELLKAKRNTFALNLYLPFSIGYVLPTLCSYFFVGIDTFTISMVAGSVILLLLVASMMLGEVRSRAIGPD